MLALRPLAEVAQPAQARREQRRRRCRSRRRRRARRGSCSGRTRTRRRCRANRPGGRGSVAPCGLRGVLEHEQPVRAGERVDRVHVARLAVEVDGEDRRGARVDRRARRVRIDQAGARRRTSHSTGVAPTCATASAEAMNVCAGTITSSPGPMPYAREHQRQRRRARRDPDAVLGSRSSAANSASNCSTSPPSVNALDRKQARERLVQFIVRSERAGGRARRTRTVPRAAVVATAASIVHSCRLSVRDRVMHASGPRAE